MQKKKGRIRIANDLSRTTSHQNTRLAIVGQESQTFKTLRSALFRGQVLKQ